MTKGNLIIRILVTVLVLATVVAVFDNALGAPLPFVRWASQGQVLAQAAPALEWSKTFGGAGYDLAGSVEQTSDGGYVMVGTTGSTGGEDSDVWLIKADSSGNKVWERTFGGPDFEIGLSAQQTYDGGYVVTGLIASGGDYLSQIWLIKTDSDGNKAWDKTLGKAIAMWPYPLVSPTSDGGYISIGVTLSYENDELSDVDVRLLKTNSNGDVVWDKTLGGADYEVGLSVQQTSDGGYIILCRAGPYEADDGEYGDADIRLVKTDFRGNRTWVKSFRRAGEDLGRSIQQTADGGYIILGTQHQMEAAFHLGS